MRLLLCVCLALLCAVLPVAADGIQREEPLPLPEEYAALPEALPESVRDLLPEELLSDSLAEVEAGAAKMGDFSYLLRTLLSLIGLNLPQALRLLSTLLGLLLLSSVVRILGESLRTAGVARAFSLCTSLAIPAAILSCGMQTLGSLEGYFTNLKNATAAAIPLLGAAYALGGNVSAAVASSASLTLFLSLMESVIATSILPFCGICLSLTLSGVIAPSLRTGTLSATIKKNYTTVLSFLMMLLLAMLSSQTLLAARSDTLAMRSAKFAAGSMIPVVGGSVSELLRTVGAGVGYLRGSVGVAGVLLLLLLLLPTLIELLLLRLVFQLAASAADMLSCDSERHLLEELASVVGFLITAVAICSSLPMIAFVLLAHCASAVG